MRFSEDDLLQLKEFASSGALKALLARMEAFVELRDKAVANLDVSSCTDRQLLIAKAEAQGANKLYKAIADDLLKIKKA